MRLVLASLGLHNISAMGNVAAARITPFLEQVGCSPNYTGRPERSMHDTIDFASMLWMQF